MWALPLPSMPARAASYSGAHDLVHSIRFSHSISRPCTHAPVHTDRSKMQARTALCQAHPRRVAKVSKQIEREIGQIMLTDKVLMDVTQARSTDGKRGGSLCSCSGIHVTNDLQVVKVYMSVLTDDESVKERILARLSGLSGYVRRRIGERVRLRLTPEIRFVHDEAVARGERVLSLLKQVESGEVDSSKNMSVQGSVLPATSGDGFWDESPESRASEGGAVSKNPFLEGVGDSAYDSDDESEEQTFFSADMFPDANPVVDEISAKERQSEWQGQKAKPRFRVKHGKAVRK
eukprot:jgi/Ulvmu1/4809/UM020_0094.1